ncbi:MAG: hypothetical protein LN561_06585 [Rickettsia endosymbiont of Labidopullus appendiculatus]|nr:hypothetical protein [Rickettsia endosymbiont of Labidopullus appendiculatus]
MNNNIEKYSEEDEKFFAEMSYQESTAALLEIRSQDPDYIEAWEEIQREAELEKQMIQKIADIEKSRGNEVDYCIIHTMAFDYSQYDTETNLPYVSSTRTKFYYFSKN